ncbi:MAG: metallophosphoesterase [Woeseia sp.]
MSVRILHLTDPHLFADPAASLRGTATHASLQSVLEHIQEAGWPADFVAMTGDVIQDDSAGAYANFRELLATLSLPVHCVPGNHDVRALMRDALSEPPFYYCATWEQHDWLVVGIDSCVDNSAGGSISADEWERLKATVEASDAAHVLVCLHHPPLPLDSRWLDQVGLEDGDSFLRQLASLGTVRGCLFGHAHQECDRVVDGLHIIGTPSTCRQFKPQSDEFALDDRPPAYRRVLLRDDGSIDSELVWLPAARQSRH